ncbi:MAG: hypothetical protein RL172_1, partial [Bacteroidota bacterium]
CTNISDGSFEIYNNSGGRVAYITTDVNSKGAFIAYNETGGIIGRLPQ